MKTGILCKALAFLLIGFIAASPVFSGDNTIFQYDDGTPDEEYGWQGTITIAKMQQEGFFTAVTTNGKNIAIWHRFPSRIIVGDAIYSVGNYAFYQCPSLREIILPPSLQTIGRSSLQYCSNLVDVITVNPISEIQVDAFADCHRLPAIPDAISIRAQAFANNYSLNTLALTNYVLQEVAPTSFKGCYGIKNLIVSDNVCNTFSLNISLDSLRTYVTNITFSPNTYRINENVFSGFTALQEITIPSQITTLEADSFSGCSGLKEVTLTSDSLLSSFRNAFGGYSNLCVIVSDGVTQIPQYSFDGCSNITNVILPSTLTSIGSFSFRGCVGLERIFIPEGVINILGGAFYGCSGIEEVDIPESVKLIREVAFSGCTLLKRVTGGEYVGSILRQTFDGCPSLKSVSLLQNINNIGPHAFRNCTSLDRIIWPTSAKIMAEGTFEGCGGLTNIVFNSSIESIGDNSFRRCGGIVSITLPEGLTNISQGAFAECENMTTINIPDSLSNVGDYAFEDCENLKNIRFGDNLNNVGFGVFRGCSSLTNISVSEGNSHFKSVNGLLLTEDGVDIVSGINGIVNIPQGVNYIEAYTFERMTGLKSVFIPDSLLSIGESAFQGCKGLTEVKYYNDETNITTIGFYPYTFKGCSSLSNLECKVDIESYSSGIGIFEDCISLTSVELADETTGISPSLFRNCSSLLKTPNLENLHFIESSAFEGCSSLSNIEFPTNETIELFSDCFKGCTGIKEVNIQTNVNIYGTGCFSGCSGIERLMFDDERIRTDTFSFCTNLKEVVVGPHSTVINYDAFHDCINLSYLDLSGSRIVTIDPDAFWNCRSLTSVYLPKYLSILYGQPFNGCDSIVQIECDPLNTRYYSKNGFLYSSNPSNLLVFGHNGDIEFTDSDNGICLSEYSFNGLKNVRSVSLPREFSVNSGSGAIEDISLVFSGCSIDRLSVDSNNVQVVAVSNIVMDKAMRNLYLGANGSAVVRYGITNIADCAFQGRDNLTSVVLPETLQHIGNFCFYDCSSLRRINIPESLTSFGEAAFINCSSITSLAFPSTIRSIPSESFQNCSSLQSISFSGEITSITKDSFYGCSSLKSIVFSNPDSAYRSINGMGVSRDGTTLVIGINGDVVIPNGISTIDTYAFNNYTNLKSVIITEGVTDIIGRAFTGCSNLSYVYIPDSIKTISGTAFEGCVNIKSVSLPSRLSVRDVFPFQYDTITSVTFRASVPYLCDNACKGCSSMESIEIDGTITRIGNFCFSGCSSLEFFDVPSNITVIGNSAFKDCTSLNTVYFSGNIPSVPLQEENYLYVGCSDTLLTKAPVSWEDKLEPGDWQGRAIFCSSESSISYSILSPTTVAVADFSDTEAHVLNIPETYKTNYTVVAVWPRVCKGNTNLIEVIVPKTIESLGEEAFADCVKLRTVCFLPSDCVVESNAFVGCSGLSSVIISNISDWCSVKFSNRYSNPLVYGRTLRLGENIITDIEFPSVEHIGTAQFANMTNLYSISIPTNVSSIGDDAFYGCSKLRNVSISGIEEYLDIAFANRYSNPVYFSRQLLLNGTPVKSIALQEGVEVLPPYIFEGNSALTNVLLPNSVKDIGDSAFFNCSGIKDIMLPQNVTNISRYAFYGCTSLTNIYIPPYVDKIGMQSFARCTNMTYITLQEGVKEIEWAAFEGCSSLKSIKLPDSLEALSSDVFLGCGSLSTINTGEGLSYIPQFAFSRLPNLTEVIVGNGVSDIGDSAFFGSPKLTNVVIGSSVSTIGSGAFAKDSGLSSIHIPNNISRIGSFAFQQCQSLNRVHVDSVEDWMALEFGNQFANPCCYGAYLMTNNVPIRNMIIPDGVDEIKNFTFFGLSQLTNVTIEGVIASIGNQAFRGCSRLKTMSFTSMSSNEVQQLDNYPFGIDLRITKIIFREE